MLLFSLSNSNFYLVFIDFGYFSFLEDTMSKQRVFQENTVSISRICQIKVKF